MQAASRIELRVGATAAMWLVAAAWVLVNHPWEGRVVFTITATHGVHSRDVLGFAVAVVVTTALWLPAPRTR